MHKCNLYHQLILYIELKILGAVYGRKDVTSYLNERVTSHQSLHIPASNSIFGDSWHGVYKTLVVVYKQDGYDPKTIIVREHGGNNQLYIHSLPRGYKKEPTYYDHKLRIIGAAYGLADVTNKIRSMVYNNHLRVRASNYVFGDTYYGTRKTLVVVYRFGSGPYRTKFVTEGRTLSIYG